MTYLSNNLGKNVVCLQSSPIFKTRFMQLKKNYNGTQNYLGSFFVSYFRTM